jgi:hypothetical protein
MQIFRGYNTTYIALGLLIFLSNLAREPREMRENSIHMTHISQSLEVLQAMQDCSVAQKIGQFVTEHTAALLGDAATSDEQHSDPALLAVANFPFGDLTSFLSGHTEGYQPDIDPFNLFGQGLEDFVPM